MIPKTVTSKTIIRVGEGRCGVIGRVLRRDDGTLSILEANATPVGIGLIDFGIYRIGRLLFFQ